jgi:hypothetical protein
MPLNERKVPEPSREAVSKRLGSGHKTMFKAGRAAAINTPSMR